jgi:hypothetical protein
MTDTFGPGEEEFDYEAADYDWWWDYGGEEVAAPEGWYTEPVVLEGLDIEGAYTIELTAEEWFEALTQSDAYLQQEYGMNHYEIIDQLEEYELWEEDDWERYGEAHGS